MAAEPNDKAEYQQAVKEFDELRAILPKFAAQRAWLRGADYPSYRIRELLPPGTSIARGAVRDVAVLALVNKGCNAHASVRTLADAGDGDNAMVLTRVILEAAVILQWMLLDRVHRLDLYCMSSLLYKRHWIELVRKYFSTEPAMVARAEASMSESDLAVTRAVYGDTKYRWARIRKSDGKFTDYSLDRMLEEIADDDPAKPPPFMHDVVYHMHSVHAHGPAEGMIQFKTLGSQKTFTCELGFSDGNAALALHGANTYLLWLLQGACNYLGLSDVEKDLDDWFARMRATQQAKNAAQGQQPVTSGRPITRSSPTR